MANTYKVQDGLTLAQKLAKGVPMTGIDLTLCNMTSATMYKAYPWRDTLKNSSLGDWAEIALVDGQQDYAPGVSDIFRMTQFWITRTDVNPDQNRDIRVAKNLVVDLQPKSPTAIRAAALQAAGTKKFRLEAAVRIPTGSTFTLGGEYQPNYALVTDLTDPLWFDDEHLEVFAKGLAYWAFYLADDSRAGSASKIGNGKIQYSGQLATFIDAIDQMAAAEDFGNIDSYYPDDSLGSVDGRKSWANGAFPYIL